MNWCGDASVWGWWWVVPLVGIVLCILMCRLSRSSAAGGRFCCGRGTPDGRLDQATKEIGELRAERKAVTTLQKVVTPAKPGPSTLMIS